MTTERATAPTKPSANTETDQYDPDPRAVTLAHVLRRSEQAELTILFGSRARGDYREGRSDIDIMLLVRREPDSEEKRKRIAAAEAVAGQIYEHPVPVELVWRTLEQFRKNRQFWNSVETAARNEGIILPRNHAEYNPNHYEDDETEHRFNWITRDNRLFHAESHLDMFETAVSGKKVDIMIGQHAHQALERGMKALLETYRAEDKELTYPETHDLRLLARLIAQRDELLTDFRVGIRPKIYNEYVGHLEYKDERREAELTSQPDWYERTKEDAEIIIERAAERGAEIKKKPEG